MQADALAGNDGVAFGQALLQSLIGAQLLPAALRGQQVLAGAATDALQSCVARLPASRESNSFHGCALCSHLQIERQQCQF